jgi:hypothetical protein
VRSTLRNQLRSFLENDDDDLYDEAEFLQLHDDDDTVEGARAKAAMM